MPKNTLITRFENGTDFDVCIWQNNKTGRFCVTTYDNVEKKHSDAKWSDSLEKACTIAEKRNNDYKI